MAAENAPFDPYESIRHIPARYNYEDSHNSALNLILSLRPEWRESKDTIEFVRFTDGITNTVCASTSAWTIARRSLLTSPPNSSSRQSISCQASANRKWTARLFCYAHTERTPKFS